MQYFVVRFDLHPCRQCLCQLDAVHTSNLSNVFYYPLWVVTLASGIVHLVCLSSSLSHTHTHAHSPHGNTASVKKNQSLFCPASARIKKKGERIERYFTREKVSSAKLRLCSHETRSFQGVKEQSGRAQHHMLMKGNSRMKCLGSLLS